MAHNKTTNPLANNPPNDPSHLHFQYFSWPDSASDWAGSGTPCSCPSGGHCRPRSWRCSFSTHWSRCPWSARWTTSPASWSNSRRTCSGRSRTWRTLPAAGSSLRRGCSASGRRRSSSSGRRRSGRRPDWSWLTWWWGESRWVAGGGPSWLHFLWGFNLAEMICLQRLGKDTVCHLFLQRNWHEIRPIRFVWWRNRVWRRRRRSSCRTKIIELENDDDGNVCILLFSTIASPRINRDGLFILPFRFYWSRCI